MGAPRLQKLILFRNGMVAAFDEHGQQMPDLQGPFWKAFRAIADQDLSALDSFLATEVDCSIVREEWSRKKD